MPGMKNQEVERKVERGPAPGAQIGVDEIGATCPPCARCKRRTS